MAFTSEALLEDQGHSPVVHCGLGLGIENVQPHGIRTDTRKRWRDLSDDRRGDGVHVAACNRGLDVVRREGKAGDTHLALSDARHSRTGHVERVVERYAWAESAGLVHARGADR